ncbi:unnamed protein product [Adineta ricciae]|uniref:Uncharacterized protein n=1 Tax=Adineta ricciae TaxID=249248 RepID=A0A815CA23_ADIRI|nr:unnamed protein product [Adineta ricciae]CAF1281188.1 unnamed protein product [Adineta ricciae]
MPVDLTCLDDYPPLPVIPTLANNSIAATTTHPSYKPGAGGLAQTISSSIIDSVFSIDDVRALLKKLFSNDINSLNNYSEISQTKPMPTIILYTSITLALFLVLSLMFCIVSCVSCGKRTTYKHKQRQSRSTQICICFLVLVYLCGIGDMIYAAYRVNKSKVDLDNTIQFGNREVYPKAVADYSTHIIQQIKNLDNYLVQPNSILIMASKSMIVQTFDRILTDRYYIRNISQSLNGIDASIKTIDQIVERSDNISQAAKDLYKAAKDEFVSMIESLQEPLNEVCTYATDTQTVIDAKLLQALDLVHRKAVDIIDLIRRDVLNPITSSGSQTWMDSDLEKQIRKYTNMTETIFLIFLIFLTVIPTGFAILVLLSCLCERDQNDSFNKIHNQIGMKRIEASSRDSISDYSQHNDEYEYNGSGRCGALACFMRVVFTLMIIMLILMTIVTGAYYTLDLAVHSACRTVHNDRSFLIPFVTEQVIGTSGFFTNKTELDTIATNIIDDCQDDVHFSSRLLNNYWPTLQRYLTDMMNELNKQVYDQFIKSIHQIDIPDEIRLFAEFVNQTNILDISNEVKQIDLDLNALNIAFVKVNASGSVLPEYVIRPTVIQFQNYLENVVKATSDRCPLPLDIIYKIDNKVCHQLGSSLSGLWLSVFFCMFLTIFGLCIFGIWVYKRSV